MKIPLLLWLFQRYFHSFGHILLIYFIQAGLHALSIIAMIFGPFSREWLAIVSHLVLLVSIFNVVQGFPVEFNQTTASVDLEKRNSEPSTDTWTDPGGIYTGFCLHSSCVNHQDFFRSVLDNMNTITSSAKSSLSTIQTALAKDRKKMRPTERSYIDLYQSLYGEYKASDKSALKNAKAKVNSLSGFVSKYNQGISTNGFKIDVYCDETVWKTDGIKDEDGDYVYALDDPLSIPTEGGNKDSICKEENGAQKILAFVTSSRDNSKDFMTVCPRAWKAWTEKSLISRKQEPLKSLLTKNIDEVLDSTPESLFLHELSHAESYFGRSGRLEDEALNDGEEAYEWVRINKLAKQDKDQTSLGKIRPLKNAGKLAPYCTKVLSELIGQFRHIDVHDFWALSQ